MRIEFRSDDCTECWDGVFYKKLSDYPNITDWEIQTVIDFINYEKANGRGCELTGDSAIVSKIQSAIADSTRKRLAAPSKICECTACPTYKGCMTDLVCHTSPVENAVKILDCGSLLSPVRARRESAQALQQEARNAANDPLDYFEYIMFAWGNCQAGDRLVMERKLKRFPDEKDLSTDFTPGVRFFFRYETLCKHPAATFEGVLPLKIKDEVILRDWVHAIVVPTRERKNIEPHVPKELLDKVYYVENDCKDIWSWSEKVYEFAKRIN